MFRHHRDGWSGARQAAFALVPVVMGAAVLVAGDDRPAPGFSRLQATQSVVAPAVSVPIESPVEAVVVAPAPAPAPGPGASVLAAGVAPSTVEGGSPEPAPSAGGGTGTPGTSTSVAGEVASPASVQATTTSTAPPTSSSSTSSSSSTTTTTAPAPAGRTRVAGVEAEVVPLTNADRTAAGLGALSRNACLDAAASGFAEQMARSGVLAHNPGAGAAANGCRADATWGDNVGMSTACDVARLEREWMASPGHRRNILTGAFTVIGVGAWADETGTCWVQVLFSS